MPDTFIIKVNFGGLGDHLFLSPLARIAKESAGFKRVLVSNLSEFRHPDYKRLIWELNPYVDGFTDEDAPFPKILSVKKGRNILDEAMLGRGLDDGVRFHEPELYFKPPIMENLRDATVFDPNFISNVGELQSAHIQDYFDREGITVDYMLKLRPKGIGVEKYGAVLETKDLEDYCSVIVSAKNFICLASGGATLAAALGKPSTVLWSTGQHQMFHHSKLHRYVELNPLPPHVKFLRRIQWHYGLTVRRLKDKWGSAAESR